MPKRIIKLVFALALLTALYAFIEPYLIGEKVYHISNPQIPGSFDGARMVFLADIHHGPFFSRSRVKKLVDRVNRLEADMVLLGGDYIHVSDQYIKPCFEELSRLKAPLGLYGVLGNHDNRKSTRLTHKNMNMAGITLIDNAGVWVNKDESGIRVGGVGDLQTDWPDIDPALNGVTADDFVILVSHNPDFFTLADPLKVSLVDLALSGHTHGWQVNLPYRFMRVFKKYTNHEYTYKSGLYRVGESTELIVSNGIGTVFLPVRFRARPQIVVVCLSRGDV